MHDAPSRHVVTGRSAHLVATDHDVVMSRPCGLDAHFPEHEQHHVHKAVEGEVHLLLSSHEREHHVVHVGIHAASPTLSAHHMDAVFAAVVEIHLVLHHLVAPEDDGRLHLPHEEAVGLFEVACHKLLHRQIERQATGLCKWQGNIFHLLGSSRLKHLQIYEVFM